MMKIGGSEIRCNEDLVQCIRREYETVTKWFRLPPRISRELKAAEPFHTRTIKGGKPLTLIVAHAYIISDMMGRHIPKRLIANYADVSEVNIGYYLRFIKKELGQG